MRNTFSLLILLLITAHIHLAAAGVEPKQTRRTQIHLTNNAVITNPSNGIQKHKHPQPLQYFCQKCSKRFSSLHGFRSHVKIHNTAAYQCDCQKIFRYKGSLLKHQQITGHLAKKITMHKQAIRPTSKQRRAVPSTDITENPRNHPTANHTTFVATNFIAIMPGGASFSVARTTADGYLWMCMPHAPYRLNQTPEGFWFAATMQGWIPVQIVELAQ